MAEPSAAHCRRGERGSGTLSTTIGVGCTLVMLGCAANLLLGLWARSSIDAVSYDAARSIATAPIDVPREVAATAAFDRARAALGSIGDEVRYDLEPSDPSQVVIRVRAPGITLMPALIDAGPTVGATDRRIVVTAETP